MKAKNVLIILSLAVASTAVAIAVYFVPDNTSIQVVGTNVIFGTSFQTKANTGYQIQVQYVDAVDSTNWVNATGTIIGTGGTVTWSYTNIGAATLPQRFFHLRVEIVAP